jgi:hypothetical protein
LFFFCYGSVVAHFKHTATRQPVVPQAQAIVETSVDNTATYGRSHRSQNYESQTQASC